MEKVRPDKGLYEKIISLAKRRGFFWPSYELYGGVSGLIDFGPLGCKMKRNIEDKWRKFFSRHVRFFEIETPIVTLGKVFEASGHVEHFTDEMTKCKNCGRKWRADHIVQEQTGISVERLNSEEVHQMIQQKAVVCPVCKGPLEKPEAYNLLFKTTIGPYAERTDYLRPETAQGMFVSFRRLYEVSRRKLPFAVAQVGRCLRNEISPRQGPIRLREFTIAEFEFFIDPSNASCPRLHEVKDKVLPILPAKLKEEGLKQELKISTEEALREGYIVNEWLAYFMAISTDFLMSLGIPLDKQRFDEKLPGERAHYSTQTYDHEVLCDKWGWIEVAGLSYRTDYDLKRHMEESGVDLRVTEGGRKFIPHVIEPSYGSDRLLYVVLENSYSEKDGRVVLKIPADIAPIKVAVFPLVSKPPLTEYACKVYEMLLNEGFDVIYDESDFIGKRYARADECGIPIAVTVDYQSVEDHTVTVRDRDTWKQVRVNVEALPEKLRNYFSGKGPSLFC